MDPALWELLRDSTDDDQEIEAIIRLDRPEVSVAGVRIVSRFGPIATCRLRKDSILDVRWNENCISLKAARALGPEDGQHGGDTAWESPRDEGDIRRPPSLSLTGAGVTVGFVDWGCDFDHPNFKRRDGSTRLRALWDQRRPAAPGAPQPYGYGVVHNRGQINRALRTTNPYVALGYHPADADRDGSGAHGSHVMDIAAGNGLAGGPVGIAPEADLVFVQLADRGTSGLANLGDSVRILEAVDFIARTAGSRPWVINISVGRHGGPHDGCTLAELALDFLLRAAPGRFIVQSAGNYFDARTHASGRLEPGQVRSLAITTLEADVTPNELEIWYSGEDEFLVQVTSPTGQQTRWVRLREAADIVEDDQVVGRIYHRDRDPNNHDNHVELFLYPWAPAGSWSVSLRAVRIRRGIFHAWLERDEACAECQARFVEADVDSACTLGTIACTHLPLVVGAYDAHSPSRQLAHFSSAGPTRDGRCKPDLVAPGVGVLAARSAPQGSTNSLGLLTRKSGTSMAAPHVTGAVALCLEGAPGPLAAEQTRALLLGATRPLTEAGGSLSRSGCGYLDVANVVAAVSARGRDMQRSRPHRSADAERTRYDPKEIEVDPQLELAVPLSLSPDTLYREVASGRGGPVSTWVDATFDVVARPGELPSSQPEAGDILVRVALGEPGLGHVAMLSNSRLTPRNALDQAFTRSERGGPGLYATVIEGGALPHARSDGFARRVLDAAGRMPQGQVLLRPRSSAVATSDQAQLDEYETEAPSTHTAEQALVGSLPDQSLAAERSVILADIASGQRNEDDLTDRVFFLRHPDRAGNKLLPGDEELMSEWQDIRSHLVVPTLLSGPAIGPIHKSDVPVGPELRKGVAPDALLSPLSITLRGLRAAQRAQPGTIAAIVVHMTSRGAAKRSKSNGYRRPAVEYALDHYITGMGGFPHYVIDFNGTIYAVCDERFVAAHAGWVHPGGGGLFAGAWKAPEWWSRVWSPYGAITPLDLLPKGSRSPNHRTIGIELLILPDLSYTLEQYRALARLVVDIQGRHSDLKVPAVPSRGLLGHEDFTPVTGKGGRADAKGGWDPGAHRMDPYFDWQRVANEMQGRLAVPSSLRLWADATHGSELAGEATFRTRQSLQPLLGYESPDDAEFDAPEHAAVAKSVQLMVDNWALYGLIAGGAFIDTRAERTADRRDGPITDWKISTPVAPSSNSGRLEPYPDLRGLANAHWYYIAPDPIGPAGGWTPETLRAALLAGDAVALSIGQIILLAGDMYGSFGDLTGRGPAGSAPRQAVNLMQGIDRGEPWAYVLLSLKQYPDFPWQPDSYAALKLLERVVNDYGGIQQEIQGRSNARFERTRRVVEFLRVARGPTRLSEAHLLARVLEVGSDPTPEQISTQAPWLSSGPQWPSDGAVHREAFNIVASDGHYLALALRNESHFAPRNWSTFEDYQRQAFDMIGRHISSATGAQAAFPIPADAIALCAFGMHYLSDTFSSGHMRVPRMELGPTGAVASRIMHDLENRYGLLVENGFGQRWRAFGDEYLNPRERPAIQTSILLAGVRSAMGHMDEDPRANYRRVLEAVGSAFKQLHYEAQRLGRLSPSGPSARSLAQNFGPVAGRLVGDRLADGQPHDATTLDGRIDATPDEKIQYLRKHQPLPLPTGSDPSDILRNHPPLYLRQQGSAVIPSGTPYRWYSNWHGMDRILRLNWHGLTVRMDFSDFFHFERLIAKNPPDWLGLPPPNRVLELVQQVPQSLAVEHTEPPLIR